MDNSAAEQYLNSLFGRAKGYVAVAYKDKGESWQECQFAWPTEKRKLLGWAKVHADANIFVCPALRQDGHTRKKGDAVPTRWLWADVDWDKVPASKRAAVRERIAEIGTLVVGSGSGDNAHVYVRLNRPVDVAEHYRLNSGLREYLYADAKHADNSLLRLPGSTNWKTEEGSPVAVRAEGPEVSVDALMEKRTFKNVKVVDLHGGDADWTKVSLTGVPRKALRWARMPVDQAVAIYGSRHKAVWAVVGDMHKLGLDSDVIHTLMDTFPAALDKNEDEHNGYDVHKDVSRRLKMDDHVADAAHDVVESLEDDEEYDFELAGDEDVQEGIERAIQEGVEKELLRRNIRRAADRHEALSGWIEPPATVSRRLTDALAAPPDPVPYLFDTLATKKANVVLTAQYKVGKTDFFLGGIAVALTDGLPFLGKFETFVPDGGVVVGHWNCEMDEGQLLDLYARPVSIENTDNLVIANLRGYRVNLLADVGFEWALRWLQDNQVKVWMIDSFSQLCRMAGVKENDNDEVKALLGAVDELKIRAGVDVCFMIAHTGRAEQQEGKERARAATHIDDWPDSRWVMTKDETETRYLRVEGRGTSLETTSLVYDKQTHRSTLGGLTKSKAEVTGWVQVALELVNQAHDAQEGPLPEKVLVDRMISAAKLQGKRLGRESAKAFVEDASEDGLIIRKKEKGARGPMVWNHYSTKGDPNRGATPRDVRIPAGGPRRRR